MSAPLRLSAVAAQALYEVLAYAAREERFDVADTSWGNDTGPSFAAHREACAIRVFLPSDDQLGTAYVVGPFSGGPINRASQSDAWVDRVVEQSCDAGTADYWNEVTSVSEFIRLLNRIT